MNRFDFEQQILKCWGLVDQIDTIGEGVLEYEWTSDQTANALFGLREIYQLEFDKLFRQFEKLVKDGNLK